MNVYYDFVILIMIVQSSVILVGILLKILEKKGLEWKKSNKLTRYSWLGGY